MYNEENFKMWKNHISVTHKDRIKTIPKYTTQTALWWVTNIGEQAFEILKEVYVLTPEKSLVERFNEFFDKPMHHLITDSTDKSWYEQTQEYAKEKIKQDNIHIEWLTRGQPRVFVERPKSPIVKFEFKEGQKETPKPKFTESDLKDFGMFVQSQASGLTIQYLFNLWYKPKYEKK